MSQVWIKTLQTNEKNMTMAESMSDRPEIEIEFYFSLLASNTPKSILEYTYYIKTVS